MDESKPYTIAARSAKYRNIILAFKEFTQPLKEVHQFYTDLKGFALLGPFFDVTFTPDLDVELLLIPGHNIDFSNYLFPTLLSKIIKSNEIVSASSVILELHNDLNRTILSETGMDLLRTDFPNRLECKELFIFPNRQAFDEFAKTYEDYGKDVVRTMKLPDPS